MKITIPSESKIIQVPIQRRLLKSIIETAVTEMGDLDRIKSLNPDTERFNSYRDNKVKLLLDDLKRVEFIANEFKGNLLNDWCRVKLLLENKYTKL